MKEAIGIAVLGVITSAVWLFVGIDIGYGRGYKAAMETGRCPHERMVNYDLERAIATCQSLKREIDNAQDHLAKSVEFMDQVKEKLDGGAKYAADFPECE